MQHARPAPRLTLLGPLAAAAIFGATLLYRAVAPAPSITIDAPAPQPLQTQIDTLQAALKTTPGSAADYAKLGWLLTQRVRENADPQLYARAGEAFDAALKLEPQHLDALLGQGSLALSRHQFADALRWGEQAKIVNPYRAQVYGVIGDAQNELGKYSEAVATIQKMVDTRPDLASYSRVSYVRELHGDTPGAIDAMTRAVTAGSPGAEGTLWSQVQLGHLYFNSGNLARAEAAYNAALASQPGYIHALAGLARVRAAQGRAAEAIEEYAHVVALLPLPEYILALGDLYALTNQPKEAAQQYDLVRAIQQLSAASGTDVDAELALFEADHPVGANLASVVTRARSAYQRRPGIHAADALAWALFKSGDATAAQRYIGEALRLGTRDAQMHFHAGAIARALGNTAGAHEHFATALLINPQFSVRDAPQARAFLDGTAR